MIRSYAHRIGPGRGRRARRRNWSARNDVRMIIVRVIPRDAEQPQPPEQGPLW